MTELTFGSLFAGIGGLDLGLERAGMRCLWQVEIDDYCNRVLAKHWPDVARYRDVREVGAHNLDPVDLICGGFPCQDVSLAGKRQGLEGKRSTLWSEFARIIDELRPRWVLAENVPGLLSANGGMFFGRVLQDLAALGYDAEWGCIPAAAVGAPHKRDRVFIVAYPQRAERGAGYAKRRGVEGQLVLHGGGAQGTGGATECCEDVAYPNGAGRQEQCGAEPAEAQQRPAQWGGAGCRERGTEEDVADATSEHGERPVASGDGRGQSEGAAGNGSGALSDTTGEGLEGQVATGQHAGQSGLPAECGGWWATEPNVGRVAHGVPARVDRLRCLGNAVVPQVAEWIGRQIVPLAALDAAEGEGR